MEKLVAFGHIGGSITAVIWLGFLSLLIAAWEAERNKKKLLEDMAAKLGVAVGELDNPALVPRLLQVASDRFSTELLRNRLSDVCGLIRTLWGWLGLLLQVAVLLAVIWYTLKHGMESAVYAWLVVAILLFFWVASLVFSQACHVLTGRYPGEAKRGRKSLAEFMTARSTAIEHLSETPLPSAPRDVAPQEQQHEVAF